MAAKKQKAGRRSPQAKAKVKPRSKLTQQQEHHALETPSVVLQATAEQTASVVGLQNLGNTCFFNAVLQGLASAPIVRDHLLVEHDDASAGPIHLGLQDAVRAFYNPGTNLTKKSSKTGGAYNPQRLFSAICKHAPEFKGYQQHDSHELLMALIDGLKEEEDAAAQEKCDGKQQQDDSKAGGAVQGGGLGSLASGSLMSTLTCSSCQHVSATAEPFVALSLQVPLRVTASKAKQRLPTALPSAAVQADGDSVLPPASPKPRRLSNKELKKQARQSKREAIKVARAAKQAKQMSQKQEEAGSQAGLVEAGRVVGCEDPVTQQQQERQLGDWDASAAGDDVAGCEQQSQQQQQEEEVGDNALLLGGHSGEGTEHQDTDMADGPDLEPRPPSGPAGPNTGGDGGAGAAPAVASGSGSGGAVALQDCVSAFFNPEAVQWACPREQQELMQSQEPRLPPLAGTPPRSLIPSMSASSTPLTVATDGGIRRRRTLSRRVSFSELKPDIKFIPGSSEQRGTDFRAALRGHVPFRRPLSFQGASLLVTADVGSIVRDKMFMRLQPYDDDEITMCTLSRPMRVSTVQMCPVQDSDDDDEQADVMARAQVLMDCVADMVEHHGVAGMRAMTMKGMELLKDEGHSRWRVQGPGHVEHGGYWDYPHGQQSAPATPTEALLTFDLGRACSFGSFGALTEAAGGITEEELLASLQRPMDPPPLPAPQAAPAAATAGLPPRSQPQPNGGDESMTEEEARAGGGADAEGGEQDILYDGEQQQAGGPAVAPTAAVQLGRGRAPARGGGGGGGAAAAGQKPGGRPGEQGKLPGGCERRGRCRGLGGDGEGAAAADGGGGDGCEGTGGGEGRSSPDVLRRSAETLVLQSSDALGHHHGGCGGSAAAIPALCCSPSRDGTGSSNYGTACSDSLASDCTTTSVAGASAEAGTPDSPASAPPPTMQLLAPVAEGDEAGDAGGGDDSSGCDGGRSSSDDNDDDDEAVQGYGTAAVARGAQLERQEKEEKPLLQPALKQYALNRLPELLCIHLKRFHHTGYGLRKIDGPVPFDQTLNLAQHCMPKARAAGRCRYRLTAVVEHRGSMRSGHYVAYVQRGMDSLWGASSPPVAGASARQELQQQCAPKEDKAADPQQQQQQAGEDRAQAQKDTAQAREDRALTNDKRAVAEEEDGGAGAVAEACSEDAALSGKAAEAEQQQQQQAPTCQNWYYVSDSHVKRVSWDDVATCEPYLLMYVREPAAEAAE